jgi:hypothetical protein
MRFIPEKLTHGLTSKTLNEIVKDGLKVLSYQTMKLATG